MSYFAQYGGWYPDSYTGSVHDGYGRTGRVVNAPVRDRRPDAWLDHLTVDGGWYATVQARPMPAPYLNDNGNTITAVHVSRNRPFGPRGGYEVGYYTGDQVIARAHRDDEPDEFAVFRRYQGGGGWLWATDCMTLQQYQQWNGTTVHGAYLRDRALAAWLDGLPCTPLHDPDAVLYTGPSTTGEG